MTNEEMINEMTRYIFEEKSSCKNENDIDQEKILIFKRCIELLSIDFKAMMEDLHYTTHLYNEAHSSNSSSKRVIPYNLLMEILRKYLGDNIKF